MEITGPVVEIGSGTACELVLRELPEWFGIEESLVDYIEHSGVLPSFISREGDNVTGILSVKRHSPDAAEIYLIAIRRDWHGSGHGLGLLHACEKWLRSEGVTFLQVKTIGPSSDDVPYSRTRAWYHRQGFVALEEMPLLWAEGNPALIMIKTV